MEQQQYNCIGLSAFSHVTLALSVWEFGVTPLSKQIVWSLTWANQAQIWHVRRLSSRPAPPQLFTHSLNIDFPFLSLVCVTSEFIHPLLNWNIMTSTPSPQKGLVKIWLHNKINPRGLDLPLSVASPKKVGMFVFESRSFSFRSLPLPYNFVMTMIHWIWDISGMYMLIPVAAAGIHQHDSSRRCTNPHLKKRMQRF